MGSQTGVEPRLRRRLRLFSLFLLLLTFITLVGSVSLRMIGGNSWIALLITSGLLLITFHISRTRFYRLAAWLAVILPAIPPISIVILRSPEISPAAELMWMALPLMVASLMMSIRNTIFVAVFYIILVAILAYFGSLEFNTVGPLMSFMIAITFVVVTITFVRQKHISEIEEQLIELQQTEKALRESEEKFSNAFKLSPQEICITSLKNGRTVEINETFTECSGFTREDIIGRTSTEMGIWTKPGDREKMLKLMKKNGRVQNEEFEFRDKDGSIRTHLFSAGPINFNGEECLISIMTDISDRKRMENTLINEATRRRLFVEQSRDGIAILDQDGKVFEVNQSFADMLGYSMKEILKLHIFDWDFSQPREQMLENIRNINESGANIETQHWRKDGTVVEVDISANTAIFNGQKLIFTVIRDITERKRMEKALRESEEKFSKAFQSVPEAISITAVKDAKYVVVNDSFVSLTGYSMDEVIGHSAQELEIWANPDESNRVKQIIEQRHSFKNEEFILQTKSKEKRTILITADTINFGGEPCLLVVRNDITERKKIENALKESEEKFSKAFHAIPEAITISRLKDGKFVDVNNSFCRAKRHTREELIGHSSDELGLWDNPGQRDQMKKWVKDQGGVVNQELEFKSKSGETQTLLFSAEIITIGGEPCMLTIGNDITQRKQAEIQLKQAMANLELSAAQLLATNKELESFSYSVSHDLRSPLRSIDGFSQALLEDYGTKLDDKGQDYLKRVRNASQKMGELIDGLLKLSRVTRSEIHQEKVDLGTLGKEIMGRLQETHPKRRVKFTVGNDLDANADPQMMRVLLENLLGNAWKFTAKTQQAEIELGMTANGAKKTFFIKDNGAGFDMAFKDKLFGAFQRLHATADFRGTGIGLATVQRIINRHGGT
ncbi:MAG: PAS domain S-box protein, partial [Dehalococcoidales bacterium]